MTQQYSNFFPLHYRIFFLLVLSIGFFFLLAYFSSVGFTQNITEPDALQKDARQLSNTQADETPHTLAGSFYTVQNGIGAKLLLNNKGITPLEVRPTLYNLAGQPLELPAVTVEASSFRFINLSEWASIGGESYKQGSIRLFHTGKDLVLGAQIYLVDESHSLSFDEKLSELGKFDSQRLEGIWAMPSREADVKIVLSNTLDCNLIVTAQLMRRPHNTSDPQTFTLAPHQTRVLDMQQDFNDGKQAARSEAVALSLEHNGTKEALLTRAFISEPSRGYSNLAQFSNPLTGKTKQYHGAGLHLETVTDGKLTPVVVVRNTAATDSNLTGRVPYTRTDGTTGVITLEQTRLRPNEIRLLNMQRVIQRSEHEQIKIAGLEIEYDTPEGSVLVSAHSQSPNRNQVFRMPMWDPLRQRTATGGYPWHIEDTSTTKAYLKNITNRPQQYVAFFNWENGGMYMIGLKSLAPRQTLEIDVKDLRDRQVPDEEGRTIPLYLSSGQFQWSLNQENEAEANGDPLSILAVLGRSEQIDYAKQISSNYACENCCVNSYYGSRISPESAEIEVGETTTITAYTQKTTCLGFPLEYREVQANPTWNTSNSSIATVSGGTVTGVAGGSASINANWTAQIYASNPPCPPPGPYLTTYLTNCLEGQNENKSSKITNSANEPEEQLSPLAPGCGTCFSAGYAPINHTAAVTVKPRVQKIQYQEPGTSNYVDITTTLYILKGSAVTFKAIPDPSNSTFPSGTPIWSGTSGATGTGQTISVTFNTVSSSTSDYKTVIAKGSANGTPVTVNVIVYELTGNLTPQDNFTNRSLIKFGLQEIVDLSFTSAPAITASQAGGLRWSVQAGTGQLTSQDDGTGTFTAPTTAESSTLRLEVLNGPSKAQFVEITISIVAPSNGYLVKTSNIARNAGAFGGAFKGNIYLEPRDVSFTKIRFSEGSAIPTTSGYLNYYSGFNHPATVGSFAVISCATVTGCKVDAEDNILTHSDPPEPPNPTTGYVGDVNWAIPWRYHIGQSVVSFTIANHHCASNAIATAALEKKGAGPYTIAITDPASGF